MITNIKKKDNCYYIDLVSAIKNQLEEHFNKYYQFLEETEGEKEFKKLHFLKLGRAVEELDKLDNPKRLYVRQLLEIEDKGVLNNE